MSAEAVSSLPARYRRHHMWWLTGLIVVAFFGVLTSTSYWQSVNSFLPESLPNQSTYNQKESGYSGFRELAQKMHLDVRQWQSPYRNLQEKNVHGTLVIISPWDTPSASEVEMIHNWVKAGNALVYLDDFSLPSSRLVLEKVGVTASALKKQMEVTAKLHAGMPEGQNVGELRGTADALLVGGNQLLTGSSATVLTSASDGAGHCLLGSMPEMCSNRYLGDAQYKSNFQFLINWLSASPGPIYFDEKAHGYTDGNNVFFFVLRSPVGFVILQMLILLVVALISLNQRFGAPLSVSRARKISNLEFIKGLAASYQRARARDTAWAMVFVPFKGRLCKSLGVAPHESLDQLAQAWAEQSGGKKAEYEAFLQRAQAALDKRQLDDNELTALIADCDRLSAGARQLQAAGRIMGS